MKAKKWIDLFIIFSFSIICFIGLFNFIIDPGKIYLNKIITDNKANSYIKKLLTSEFGIIQTGWNERLIKTTLATEVNSDCYIVGSSHVMSFSYLNNTGNIQYQCKNIINLGVSGAGLEDIAIMSYLLITKFSKPKKVFIGLDPWDLKFNMDSRYGMYKNYLEDMNELVKEYKNEEVSSYKYKYITNLINKEYTINSYYNLKKIISNEYKNEAMDLFNKDIKEVPYKFDDNLGSEEAVTLKDGSHVYPKDWIIKQKNNIKNISSEEANYKISGLAYDVDAIQYLKKIINIFQINNIDVNFILTPYHPNIFKNDKSIPVKYMGIIEDIVHQIAKEKNINVYGSYNPTIIGCTDDEFFDFMHAKKECLNKIKFDLN